MATSVQVSLTVSVTFTGLAKVSKVQEELKRIVDDLRLQMSQSLAAEACVSSSSNACNSPSHHVDMRNTLVIPLDCDDIFEDNVTFVASDCLPQKAAAACEDLVDSDDSFPPPRRKSSKLRRLSRNSKAVDLTNIDEDSDSEGGMSVVPSRAGSSSHRPSVADDEEENKAPARDVWKSILGGKNPKRAKTTSKRKSKKSDLSSKHEASGDSPTARGKQTGPSSLGKKILVFGHHKNVMDALEDCIRDMGVGYVRIDGDVSISLRDSMIDTFQT